LWTLLIGGQYDVGTDYFTYLEMFRSGDLRFVEENRGEILFSGFVSTLYNIGIRGQGIYLVLAIIWGVTLFGIAYKCVGSRWLYLFFFVFIVFPGMFNNQMNVIRQYSAIYILTMGICFLFDKQYLWAALLFISSIYVHTSALFIIPLILIIYFWVSRCKSWLWLSSFIIIGIIVSFLVTPDLVMRFLMLDDTPYAHYVESDLFMRFSLSTKLPKYICAPLFFLAIYIFTNRCSLNERDMRLFVTGIVGYAIRLAFLSFGVLHRIGLYFDLLACIPLVYLLVWLNCKHRLYYYAVMVYMLVPYAVKVLISTTGEYSYDNFLLH